MLMPLQAPSADSLQAVFEAQRAAFAGERYPSRAQRLSRLDSLLQLLVEHEAEFIRAIDGDFSGRSAHETRLAELFIVRAGIRHAQAHLGRWMHQRRLTTALHFLPASNRLLPQPLGVVGIVSPWNYPLQLALGPSVAALAAGNRVIIKPSELTPRFCAALAQRVAQRFDATELTVVCGDAELGRAFTALPFDHLFFTGSTAVGRQVAQAAAANLTPVTLELGGKSPAVFDPSVNLAEAVPRLAFGKLLNAGQTCIAPDYLLVPRGQTDRVVQGLKQAVSRLFPTLRANADYTAIISDRHRQRLQALVDEAQAQGARIVVLNPSGDSFDTGTRKLAPTLVLGATPAMRIMREEIFGPVLPIVEYDGLDDAIAQINAGDRPLALYWFGRDSEHRDHVLRETHAGGVTVNDCLWHLAQESQPFGGVGASGQGAYHGQWGFDRFSHLKPVFRQARLNGTFLFHPPYGRTFDALLALLQRIV
ncbi:MAG: coniferyl aldehyde dehydrogenase [Variovorax sp.]